MIKEENPTISLRRRKTLFNIDLKIDVSNLELEFLDLTPYFKDSDGIKSSFFEQAILASRQTNIAQHCIKNIEKPIYLMRPQVEVLKELLNPKNIRCMILAPTSFGKTFIIKEYIYLAKPKKIVYIVPTNALSYELEESFKSNTYAFGDYEVFDRSLESANDDKEYLFFIGTQERFLEVQHQFKSIDLFVIDEAYKLQDTNKNPRAYKLSKAFLDSVKEKTKKTILLSPIANVHGFSDSEYNFSIYRKDFNAVARQFHVVETKEFIKTLDNKLNNKEKSILFIGAPYLLAEYANEIKYRCSIDENMLKILREDFHPDWMVTILYEKGILTHHGQMPRYLQNKMINLFLNNEKQYYLLIGTNSISEGINTPTKNLFITEDLSKKDRLFLIKNTIGRAGRLGDYPVGHIYSTSDISSIDSSDTDVTLSLIDDKESEIVKDTEDESEINNFIKKQGITRELYDSIIDGHNISKYLLGRILDSLKKNRDEKNFLGIIPISSNAFGDKFGIIGLDQRKYRYILYATLKKGYTSNKHNKWIPFSSYINRIDYYLEKSRDSSKDSNSLIMDMFMKMKYSILDYKLAVVADIASKLLDANIGFPFGNNVITITKEFNELYSKHLYEGYDKDSMTDKDIKVLMSLREYGISLSNEEMGLNALNEISAGLKNRFSTYDIIRRIMYLSNNSADNKEAFSNIVDKYL